MQRFQLFPAFFKAAVLALFCALVATSAQAQDEGVQSGVQSVITDQIAAFREDDFATAFAYASPSIQAMFGTAENFGAMVRQGYPMVHRPAELRFLDLRALGERMVQRVMVIDAEGRLHLLDYDLVAAGSTFRISGVRLVPAPAPGV